METGITFIVPCMSINSVNNKYLVYLHLDCFTSGNRRHVIHLLSDTRNEEIANPLFIGSNITFKFHSIKNKMSIFLLYTKKTIYISPSFLPGLHSVICRWPIRHNLTNMVRVRFVEVDLLLFACMRAEVLIDNTIDRHGHKYTRDYDIEAYYRW